jgi:hypothetical protein
MFGVRCSMFDVHFAFARTGTGTLPMSTRPTGT